MKRKLLVVFLLGMLPFIYSCEGPEGPAGPEGPQGIAGEKGDPGDPAGAVQFSLDTLSTNASGERSVGLTLTQDIAASVENGVILVYAKNNNTWFPLPGLVFFTNEAASFSFAYQVSNLNFGLLLYETSATPKARKFQKVRLVIVPAVNGRLNAELDWKNYEEVRKALNLPE